MAQYVAAHHLRRLVCLYIRQSTLQQVFENTESTSRQYALRERAQALGWAEERIVVIDQDLGHSGASTADRLGFQWLEAKTKTCKTDFRVGSFRLARNSSDWHHLLEMCALTRTLILDEEGLYDTATFNDRFLLDLKDAISETELFVIQDCLQGGILNKARRGALKLTLPIGLCYPEGEAIVLDPDMQVQASIREVFRSFAHTVCSVRDRSALSPAPCALSAASAVRPASRRNRLGRPSASRRLTGGAPPGLRRSLCRMARTRTPKTADGKVHIADVPRSEWVVLIKDVHVGYIRLRGLREK